MIRSSGMWYVHFPLPSPPNSELPDNASIKLSKAAAGQRSLHSTYIRSDILGYLQPSPEVDLGIVMPSNLDAEMRGLNHKMTARFLIPRRLLEAFEEDPDT